MKILVTGATGLIGKELILQLISHNHQIVGVSRTPSHHPQYQIFSWDYTKKIINPQALEGIEGVIHLAGEPIDQRWTPCTKQKILESRIESAEFLYEQFLAKKHPLKLFVTASGANYYGSKSASVIKTEEEEAGDDFLAEVCELWENTAFQFQDLGARVVALRTGVVLTHQGGAVPKMLKLIQLGFGAILGTGKQYMPWIHLSDLLNMYQFVVDTPTLFGAYNAVAPGAETNQSFTEKLAKKCKKKLLPLAVPSVFLKLFLGEMSSILLEGCPLSAKKIMEQGFVFQYPTLTEALDSLKTN